ncbi:hypothetical protein BDV93DRAFT_508306 [Ceratobasidium sp. AG-I]|nr:hypothetical protein BDV93DRAFT_508306 [Ceratobasidium sp. AG-I]
MASHQSENSTIVQSASGGDSNVKSTLNKSEACHQCRKRKVVGNSAPHKLALTDSAVGLPSRNELTWEEDQVSQQNLDKLEARVEQLEGLISGDQTSTYIYPSFESTFSSTGAFDEPLDFPNPFALPILNNGWPPSLPPRPLLFHLVDLFFTCYPNSRRVLHRPTFLSQLLEPPTSPHFPFIAILHAICAVAAAHSPLVTVAPALPKPSPEIEVKRTQYQEGRQLMFDEEQYVISRKKSIESAREGDDLVGVIQGFNLQDSLQKPLPQKIRDNLLVGPPLSHTEVELRRNLFWLSYCVERYHLFVSPWPFDISDEDIQQTLPGTLEAFEAGVDDGEERQHVLSTDLFTFHGNNLDDFGLFVKCAVMLSRAHTLQNRHFAKYDSLDEIRNSHELEALNGMISAMRSSSSKPQFSLNEQLASSAISNLSIAHMSPHLATIKAQIILANWKDPSCESANKALSAARAILRYITGLTSSSWDLLRLDKTACICWSFAGRVFLAALEHAPESQAVILREEIKQIRKAYRMAGDRVVLFLRQRQSLDAEIVEQLGEREAAKLFQEDFLFAFHVWSAHLPMELRGGCPFSYGPEPWVEGAALR